MNVPAASPEQDGSDGSLLLGFQGTLVVLRVEGLGFRVKLLMYVYT